MKLNSVPSRMAAAIVLGSVVSGAAYSQTFNLSNPGLSLRSSTSGDTWHTVMIVSAILLVVGLIDNNSTLAVIGGAGILFSLYETGNYKFQYQSAGRGFDFAKSGPVSFGVSPFGPLGLSGGNSRLQPSVYAIARIKF